MKITEPIRGKHQVRELLDYFSKRGEHRNCVLITLCVYTALRISDVLALSCDDVFDFSKKCPRKSITLVEKKTGKSKRISLNKNIIAALTSYLPDAESGCPLILNPKTGESIGRIQAYRIIRAAAEAVEIAEPVSCHSLRKTFGYHAWKNGVSPAVLMEIYNHSSLAVTRRYLGVTQDDMNDVYMDTDFSIL